MKPDKNNTVLVFVFLFLLIIKKMASNQNIIAKCLDSIVGLLLCQLFQDKTIHTVAT